MRGGNSLFAAFVLLAIAGCNNMSGHGAKVYGTVISVDAGRRMVVIKDAATGQELTIVSQSADQVSTIKPGMRIRAKFKHGTAAAYKIEPPELKHRLQNAEKYGEEVRIKKTSKQESFSDGSASASILGSSAAKAALRLALPAALVAGSILVFLLPGLREQFGRLHELSDYLTGLGWKAPILFIPAVALLVAIGVPRLLLCTLSGMAFGFWKGLLWMQLGTIIGFYGLFLFVRWSGRDYVLRLWPRLARYTAFSRKNGFMTVLLIRQLPVTGFYTNLILGLMPLSHADFLLGSCIGILPAAVPATLIGSGATAFSSGKIQIFTLVGIFGGIGLWLAGARLLRSFLKKKSLQAADDSRTETELLASAE